MATISEAARLAGTPPISRHVFDQTDRRQNDDGANSRLHDCPRDTSYRQEARKQPSCNESSDHTHDDVRDEPETCTSHHLTGQQPATAPINNERMSAWMSIVIDVTFPWAAGSIHSS
jgi:hypothetical protein